MDLKAWREKIINMHSAYNESGNVNIKQTTKYYKTLQQPGILPYLHITPFLIVLQWLVPQISRLDNEARVIVTSPGISAMPLAGSVYEQRLREPSSHTQ